MARKKRFVTKSDPSENDGYIYERKLCICLYWTIGKAILEKQEEGWGAKVIDRMAKDLKEAFPDMTEFSPRNNNWLLGCDIVEFLGLWEPSYCLNPDDTEAEFMCI